MTTSFVFKKTSLIIFFAIHIFFSSMTSIAVFAETNSEKYHTVYVDTLHGNDSNSGESQSHALATINQAIEVLSSFCKDTVKDMKGLILLCSDYTVNDRTELKLSEHKKLSIEISTIDNSKLILGKDVQYNLGGPTVFKNINIVCNGTVHFIANFNPITFDEGVVFQSEASAKTVKVYGGYMKYTDGTDVGLDSHITIKSGELFSTVVGFTAQKGDKSVTFTGTSYIDIYGGSIDKVVCSSYDSHICANTVVNMYGGNVGSLYIGGNFTRCLSGKASVNISDGHISSLNINNVLGDVDLSLDRVVIDSARVSYFNNSIMNSALGSCISVMYNSKDISKSIIDSLKASADKYGIDMIITSCNNGESENANDTSYEHLPVYKDTDTVLISSNASDNTFDTAENTMDSVYLIMFTWVSLAVCLCVVLCIILIKLKYRK